MLFLLLAILSSTGVSVMMRLAESKPTSKMGTLLFNYGTCSMLGAYFAFYHQSPLGLPGGGWALFLGAIGGILFLASLMLMQKNIAVNGVVLSSTFMKMGVVVPTLMAILFFGEVPRASQVLGYVLCLYVILTLDGGKSREGKVSNKTMLLLLLLVGGLCDAMPNIFDKTGEPAWADAFLVLIFFTAFLLTLVLYRKSGEPLTKWDVFCGLGVGIPNYFSSRFQLAALRTLPAVLVFPVCSVASLALITLAGRFFFKEQLNRKKYISLAIIAFALVLLNI